MMDVLKKVMLFGVGAVATTYDKAVDLIDELVKKGKITVEEGKELGDELKRSFKEKSAKLSNKDTLGNTNKIHKENSDIKIDSYNYVTRDEYEILKARVYSLEKQLNNKE